MIDEPPVASAGPFSPLDDTAQSETIFRKLLDSAPDAVVVVDQSGRIVLVNVQSERFFGYVREELLGQNVEILVPDRFRARHHGHRAGFFGAPKLRPMGSGLELFGRKRDGSEFPIEISLSPVATPQGMLVSASIRDITDRKQSEFEMRRIQEHLLAAVENIQGAFAIFDAENQLVLCNAEYARFFGEGGEGALVGRSFEQLLDSPTTQSTFGSWAGQALRAYRKAPTGALDLRTSDGRSLRIVERRTSGGGTLTTIWDITEDVKHEEELERARALAEDANSAKSEFLSSMSHELRTPLNAILGFAQLLQRDKKMPLPERHRERIDHILKGGEHLLRLIDDVLDLSRIESGRVSVSVEMVSVTEVLLEVHDTLEPMASRADIELVMKMPAASFPPVSADRTRFKQVLMNFGSNAIKYGRKGGRATFLASEHGGRIRVAVKDDGIGVARDKQANLFQPFNRAGQEAGPIEGTGIGLAISKRLAELMGGSVGFHSGEGQGCEFWVELPAHHPEELAPPSIRRLPTGRMSPLFDTEGPRYLVVYIEDNPSNIAFMSDLIADFERVELVTAPTAEIGLEIVRSRRPNLVIMDLNLPGMSGVEATQQLRQWPETRDIPVVALSASAMVHDEARITGAGFHCYLTKPVKVDELAKVLEELLLDERPT